MIIGVSASYHRAVCLKSYQKLPNSSYWDQRDGTFAHQSMASAIHRTDTVAETVRRLPEFEIQLKYYRGWD